MTKKEIYQLAVLIVDGLENEDSGEQKISSADFQTIGGLLKQANHVIVNGNRRTH